MSYNVTKITVYKYNGEQFEITENNFKYDLQNKKIDKILGTHDWEDALYRESQQLSVFDMDNYERVELGELVDFLSNRLKSVFAYVSPKSRVLKNSKNSPLFILYFMMTNNSPKAIGLGSKVVNQIFDKIDSITKGSK